MPWEKLFDHTVPVYISNPAPFGTVEPDSIVVDMAERAADGEVLAIELQFQRLADVREAGRHPLALGDLASRLAESRLRSANGAGVHPAVRLLALSTGDPRSGFVVDKEEWLVGGESCPVLLTERSLH